MMLRERWLIAGVVGLGLLSAAVLSPGQAPARKPKVVQPDSGTPPEQAVQIDQAAPLDQTMPPDPGLPPEEDSPAETAKPEAAVVATPESPAPEPQKQKPQKLPPQKLEPARVAGTPEQQQLERDAARLLQLTEELKAEVEKAGSNTLSLAALRKADEVQKLSRELKERMKERGQPAVSKP
jgi:hypothetical protein